MCCCFVSIPWGRLGQQNQAPKGIKCKNNISIMHEKENGISMDHTNISLQKKCDAQCNPSDTPDNPFSKDSEEGNMINARINYMTTLYGI